jgi:2'-5' RNA ligase
MRLFIAFDIISEFYGLFHEIQKRLPVKGSFPKGFNLTLKFIGDVDESKVPELIERLNNISFDKFDVNFSGIGFSPNENSPRIIWFALESKDVLTKLVRDIEEATKGFGIAQDKTFIPHVTIARVKNIIDRKEFNKIVDGISVPTEPFTLSKFKLIKSTLTKDGPVYDVIKEFP